MSQRPWIFHPDALGELDEAGRRYEEGREGIGEEFVDAVYEELSKAATPASPTVVVPGVRSANVRHQQPVQCGLTQSIAIVPTLFDVAGSTSSTR